MASHPCIRSAVTSCGPCASCDYDGHTLAVVIDGTEKLTGCAIERAYVDKGYRGHDTANPHRVFVSGQKRGVFGMIKRELRRRSAIEAVIGHMKTDGHLGRCYLKGREGDAANVILTAVGHNLRLVLAWLSSLLRLILLTRDRSALKAPAIHGRGWSCRWQSPPSPGWPPSPAAVAPAEGVQGRTRGSFATLT